MIAIFKAIPNLAYTRTSFLLRYATPLLVTVLSIGCSSATSTKQVVKDSSGIIELPPPGPLSEQEAAKYKQAAQKWYDSALKPRAFNGGMLVAKNGTVVFEQYNGTVRIPGSEPITATTPMHIASISKTFTAMSILKLQQDGKLNIDEEFSKYFPAFNYPGVTIRTLLNHRSGLPNYTHFLEKMGWDKKKIVTNQDILDFLIAHKAEMQDVGRPNTRFAYCNTNFALLALLAEKVSGTTFPEFLKATFFDPLQMKHTHVFTMADSATYTPSYEPNGRIFDFTCLDAVYGDKNVYTTPEDLLIWDRALSTGKLFTAATLEQAYTPYSNEKAGIKNYGLGWRMNNYPNGKKIIFHNGWWHGSNAALVRLLQDSAVIIVIGNKFNRNIYHANVLANVFEDYFAQGDAEEEADNSTTTVVPEKAKPAVKAKPAKARVVKTKAAKPARTTKKAVANKKAAPVKKKRK